MAAKKKAQKAKTKCTTGGSIQTTLTREQATRRRD